MSQIEWEGQYVLQLCSLVQRLCSLPLCSNPSLVRPNRSFSGNFTGPVHHIPLPVWLCASELKTCKRQKEAKQLRPCLGLQWQCVNARSGNNPAERLASAARLPNARNAKRRCLNCAGENQVIDVRAAFAYKRRASATCAPKQGIS